MVNPWTYYIVNDEMPDIYSCPDPKWGTKLVLVVVYYLVVSILWGFGVMWFLGKVVGFGSEKFFTVFLLTFFPSLAVYVALMIIGINKILKMDMTGRKQAGKMESEADCGPQETCPRRVAPRKGYEGHECSHLNNGERIAEDEYVKLTLLEKKADRISNGLRDIIEKHNT